jgi:probable rRNA maturation factor
VDDAEMTEINRDYRDRPRPTNVIAFSMRDGAFPELNPTLLGDVVISSETCRRESQAAGIPFEARLEELLVHGILHLFDYDHEQSPEAEDRMWAKTEEILARIPRSRA